MFGTLRSRLLRVLLCGLMSRIHVRLFRGKLRLSCRIQGVGVSIFICENKNRDKHYIRRLHVECHEWVKPPCPPSLYIGWVGVCWQWRCQTCRSLRQLVENQGARYFWRSATAGCRVRPLVCEVKNLYSAQQGNSPYHPVFLGRHPRGSYIVLTLLSLEAGIPRFKLTRWSCHPWHMIYMQAPQSRYKGSIVACSLPFMCLAGHLTARRAWCMQCLPGRSKPDMLRPGIIYRDARVYGQATAAMHEIDYISPIE